MECKKEFIVLYKVCLLCIIYIYLIVVAGYESNKVLMKKFSQCRNETNLMLNLLDFKVSQKEKNKYYLNGIVKVKEDMPQYWVLRTDVYKCNDIYNLEACEIYLDKLRNTDGCSVLNQTIDDFPNAFANFEPRMNCPLKAGEYKLQDCHINPNVAHIQTYATSGSILITVQGFENDKKLFCFDTRFDITNRLVNSG